MILDTEHKKNIRFVFSHSKFHLRTNPNSNKIFPIIIDYLVLQKKIDLIFSPRSERADESSFVGDERVNLAMFGRRHAVNRLRVRR
jgi:hypothetical protein